MLLVFNLQSDFFLYVLPLGFHSPRAPHCSPGWHLRQLLMIDYAIEAEWGKWSCLCPCFWCWFFFCGYRKSWELSCSVCFLWWSEFSFLSFSLSALGPLFEDSPPCCPRFHFMPRFVRFLPGKSFGLSVTWCDCVSEN